MTNSTRRRRACRNLLAICCGTVAGLVVGVLGTHLIVQYNKRRRTEDVLVTFGGSGAAGSPRRGDEEVGGGDVPNNAPTGCPGVQSGDAGFLSACDGCPNKPVCMTGQASAKNPYVTEIANKLTTVKHKILVLSGKGGVGKSTIATQMAWELRRKGFSVGLLDVDICGPSIPRMTGTMGKEVRSFGRGWLPVYVDDRFSIMSIGYLLPTDDGAVIWRGPKKNGLIRQFFTDVHWGDLDYLIVDTPPGTSDEHLSIVTLLAEAGLDGAIVVTTPQEVSLQDVRKEINFCKSTGIKVLGVVENMSKSVFSCLDPTATLRTCGKMEVPYAGAVALNDAILCAGEKGVAVSPDCQSAMEIQQIVENCLHLRSESS